MQISLDFPDTSPVSQLPPLYLKQALTTALYHAGKLSSRQACVILGVSRRQFEDILPQFGFSILRDDPETLQIELGQ